MPGFLVRRAAVVRRITIFDPAGKSRGHVRSWDWNDWIFNPDLAWEESSPGTTVGRALENGEIGGVGIRRGDTIVVRTANPGSLRDLLRAAARAGAADTLWFRLPGASDSGGWSIPHTRSLSLGVGPEATPRLELGHGDDGRLILGNRGNFDLPPRFSGAHGAGDRGWQLEVEAADGSPVFRELADAGDFIRAAGHRNPDGARPVPVPLHDATRLTLWFEHLPSGEFKSSGPLRLDSPVAAVAPVSLRWRVLGTGADWQALDDPLPASSDSSP